MAGTGDRFVNAGYIDPKPLIKVNGKRIIEYICEMFDLENDELIFICNNTHLQTTNMKYILNSIIPGCEILSIPNHKKGPIFTMLASDINDHIKDDEEVIVCYCDNPYIWNYNHFKNWVKEHSSDGCSLSHSGF